MVTDAIRSQIAAKWQDSFNRLNGNAPGISGLLNFSEARRVSTEFLSPTINISMEPGQQQAEKDIEQTKAALGVVAYGRRLPALLDTFLDDVRRNFCIVENEIANYMGLYEAENDIEYFKAMVPRILAWYTAWEPPKGLGLPIRRSYTLTFQTRLFATLPPSFAVALKELCQSFLDPHAEPATRANADVVLAQKRVNEALWENFERLGLVERFESVIASVGYECIEEHIKEKCTGEWEKAMLDELRSWMTDRVVPWMLLIYARTARTKEEARSMLQGVGSRFDFHMNKALCDLRTKEIFDIIIDFPESTGALQDLRECLLRVGLRNELVKALRTANRKRLLQPAADTKLILAQYVATIKCLRIIDPPGVLLYKVADPIRRYLRQRPDTIRCIVANLVGDDDGGDSLVDENEPVQALHLQQRESEDYTDPAWEPDPVDAGPEFRANKPSDIISTLVSIYDSKDLFVKELQVLLAQRLLAINRSDVDKVERERRNIEILKIRFGEAALQVCEVMLKDMTDSKRIDVHIQSHRPSIVHPTIISRQFWPSLENSDMVMPGQFNKLQEEYSQEFNVFKPDKRLKWLPHLGTVQLQLELEDRVLDFDVLPLEAAFIELFSERGVWTLEELILAVGGIDRSSAIKALSNWVDHGVLKEDPENTFRLLERAEEADSSARDPSTFATSIPEAPAVSSVQQQQAEQMRVHWKFIEGMLTNLGTLPLHRIQTMLKFVPGYDQSIDHLASFMEAARREGLVLVRDGVWRLNR